ncbi:hypothetical protein [Bradyrhizobium sp.]|uniref:hypothetical protein n=1 Tax=Bradyrhizobium sp. TaxID=376 RepID=UPI002611AC1E|nr:hypothetical protein [Bradyrhizobium sp.]
MTNLAIASVIRVESVKQAGERSAKTIALFTCFGLMASLCVMTLGVDLSAGWGLM